MTALAEIRKQVQGNGPKPIPAATVISLSPSEFCDDFPGRPPSEEVFGLRSPSEADLQLAIEEAKRQPEEKQDTSFLVAIVSRCLCEPMDVMRAHRIFPKPDLLVPRALKPLTIRRIWDELEKARVESSPIFPEATDEEAVRLAVAIEDGALTALDLSDPTAASRCRRYLRFALEAMESDNEH
jgi:hypothetical protein